MLEYLANLANTADQETQVEDIFRYLIASLRATLSLPQWVTPSLTLPSESHVIGILWFVFIEPLELRSANWFLDAGSAGRALI